MASRRFEIFLTLQRGQRLPFYEVVQPETRLCPTLSETGRQLEIINLETIRRLNLSDPDEGVDRTYRHSAGGTQLFWIPLRYIP